MEGAFTEADAIERYSALVEEGLFDHESEAVSYFGSPPARILDVGCGAGRVTKTLVDAGFDVVGLDVSREMVRAADRLVPEAAFVHGSATDLPFADGSFDHALFAFNGLDTIPTESGRRATLSEIRRVLTDGGRFVFSSHNSRYVIGSRLAHPFPYYRILRFWLRNVRMGRIGRRYKYAAPAGQGLTKTYFISPEEQRRQLREFGLEPLGVFSRYDSDLLAKVDPWPYYVAEKR